MRRKKVRITILSMALALSAGMAEEPGIQRIRLVQDDAQNYMVSKIYELKHRKANELVPFVLGAVKRYAANSTVDRINYSAGKKQFVSVSCPVEMMPHVDDMILKLDREAVPEGTGIIRNVYTPKYRASARMMEIMVKAGIPSNADEGANQDAAVAFDSAANLIYWKDSINKDKDMKKYLSWLDRPLPQVTLALKVYEIRESDLMDLGIDYLAWKNGPGLNLLDVGMKFMDGTGLESVFGPYGFFMFAPSFDFSFVRILQQNGKARLASSNGVTILNNNNVTLEYTPGFQNLTKDAKFASAVKTSSNDKIVLQVNKPVISMNGEKDANGLLKYTDQDYLKQSGVVNFSYSLTMKNVVERNNLGDELFEESFAESSLNLQTGREKLLAKWEKEQEVEQTIGVPFLCEIPILKYIFGTTTRSKEKIYYYLAVRAELAHPDQDINEISGKLVSVPELLKNVNKEIN